MLITVMYKVIDFLERSNCKQCEKQFNKNLFHEEYNNSQNRQQRGLVM